MHTERGLDWHPVALFNAYEAEIRRHRVENDTLKIHYNSVAVKLQALSQEKPQNAAKVQANQTLYNSQKTSGSCLSQQGITRKEKFGS